MTTMNLTAVDQAMAFSDNSMPQNLIDAWSYTTTFAQAYARTVNSDPSSQAYFNAMTGQLAQLAWNITEATQESYTQQAGSIRPADIVTSIINPYLTPDQQAGLAGILNAIQQPTAGVNDFLTFWWNKASTNANQTSMALGPLTEVDNSSNITVIYYSFNFSAESWRSLFVAQSSADLVVTAYRLRMNLNLALYTQISGDIIQKLAGKEKDHIASTPIDL